MTPAEVRALRAYALTGNRAEAATALGIHLQTLKNELSSAYASLGVNDGISAFRALGWLRVPGEDAMVAAAIVDDVLAAATVVEEAAASLRAATHGLGPASPREAGPDPDRDSLGTPSPAGCGDDPARDHQEHAA